MAAQQIQIAETIRAMKLAFKRRPDGKLDLDVKNHDRPARVHITEALAYWPQINLLNLDIHNGYMLTDLQIQTATTTSSLRRTAAINSSEVLAM